MKVNFTDILTSSVSEHGISQEEILSSEKNFRKVKKSINEKRDKLYFPLNYSLP